MSKLLKSELQLSGGAAPLHSNKVLCIGCHQEFDRILCQTGRIYQGIVVRSIPQFDTELTYDDNDNLIEETVVATEIKRPMGSWSKGYICSTCAADYRTVEHTRQDGSKWYEPRVQVDITKVWTENKMGKRVLKPSHSVSINPGWSVVDELGIDAEYNPTSELWQAPVAAEIHYPSYNKFARGR
jgi:hypothetical protein